MKKELICITCPLSCHLSIELKEDTIQSITGNTCPRGVKYAESEMLNPTRMITSTVIIEDSIYKRIPVISSCEIPKNKIFEVMKEINKIKVKAPIKINEILIKNVCGLEANIIASRSMGLK